MRKAYWTGSPYSDQSLVDGQTGEILATVIESWVGFNYAGKNYITKASAKRAAEIAHGVEITK